MTTTSASATRLPSASATRIPSKIGFGAALACVGLCSASSAIGAGFDFSAPTVISIPYSRGPAVGDFDGDGCADLALVPECDERRGIEVYRGGDPVAPAPPITVIPDAPVGELFATDFDRDGKLDLLVVTGAEMRILAYRSLGGLSFAAPVESSLGVDSSNLFFHADFPDFDGDGTTDVVGWNGFGQVSVALGDTGGAFALAAQLDTDDTNAVAVGDLDGDASPDLVIALSRVRRLVIVPGDGAGGLGLPSNLDLPFRPAVVEPVDLDEDGDLDLVVGSPGLLTVLDADGAGGFGTPETQGAFSTSGIGVLAVADWNEDGHADVLAVESDRLEMFIGNGLGGLAKRPTASTTPFYPRALGVLDLDGDGHLDAAARSEIEVYVHFGDGEGAFPRSSLSRDGIGTDPRRLLVGDFDSDGNADMAALAFEVFTGPGSVSILPGDGAGGLGAARTSTAGQQPYAFATGDFDEDGYLDLAVANGAGDPIFLLENDGTGLFPVPSTLDPGGRARLLATGALDGDAHVDLLLLLDTPARLVFVAGEGDGGFAPPVEVMTVSESTCDLLLADMNDDARLDVVAIDPTTARVYLGDGAGGFVLQASTPIDVRSTARLAAGDVDGDGRLDLVADTVVLLGDGAGGLGQPLSFLASVAPSAGDRDVTLADFDRDGRLDVAFSLLNPTAVDVLPGDGTGGFGAGRQFGIGGSGVALDSGDFDEDGRPDLAVLSKRPDVRLLVNRTVHPIGSRAGNVNARAGAIADVLFVNDSIGVGSERELTLGPADPVEIRMENSPSRPRSRFALYGWPKEPTERSGRDLAFGLGGMCLPPPLAPACRFPIAVVWNNIVGHDDLLGTPNLPSSPAPSVVATIHFGLGSGATVFLQGIVLDRAAPNGRAAVTNGILLRTP